MKAEESTKVGQSEKCLYLPGMTRLKRGGCFDEVTINGCLGDDTKASPEIGKAMVETAPDRLVPYLKKRMAQY